MQSCFNLLLVVLSTALLTACGLSGTNASQTEDPESAALLSSYLSQPDQNGNTCKGTQQECLNAAYANVNALAASGMLDNNSSVGQSCGTTYAGKSNCTYVSASALTSRGAVHRSGCTSSGSCGGYTRSRWGTVSHGCSGGACGACAYSWWGGYCCGYGGCVKNY